MRPVSLPFADARCTENSTRCTGHGATTGRPVSSHVVVAARAIKPVRLHPTVLETTSRHRRGTDHCDRVSRNNSLSPCTIRMPFFTRCSEGKPLRRLLLRSKGAIVGSRDPSPFPPVIRPGHGSWRKTTNRFGAPRPCKCCLRWPVSFGFAQVRSLVQLSTRFTFARAALCYSCLLRAGPRREVR